MQTRTLNWFAMFGNLEHYYYMLLEDITYTVALPRLKASVWFCFNFYNVTFNFENISIPPFSIIKAGLTDRHPSKKPDKQPSFSEIKINMPIRATCPFGISDRNTSSSQ